MKTSHLTKTTCYRVYKKDKAEIDTLKWHFAKKKNLDEKLSEPDLMTAMVEYIKEKEKIA